MILFLGKIKRVARPRNANTEEPRPDPRFSCSFILHEYHCATAKVLAATRQSVLLFRTILVYLNTNRLLGFHDLYSERTGTKLSFLKEYTL